jgi:hypothetical protein
VDLVSREAGSSANYHAAAFVKRSFLGRGWLTVSTFDLTSPQAEEIR